MPQSSDDTLHIRLTPAIFRVWVVTFCLSISAVFVAILLSGMIRSGASGWVMLIALGLSVLMILFAVLVGFSAIEVSIDFRAGVVRKQARLFGLVAVRSRSWREISAVRVNMHTEWSTGSEGHETVTARLIAVDGVGHSYVVIGRLESFFYPVRGDDFLHPRIAITDDRD
jgi:hypothetical protein